MGIIGPGKGAEPTGPAGGSLSGTYPNPGLANSSVTENQVVLPSIPSGAGAEKSITVGTGGIMRSVIVSVVGDGVKKEWKFFHGRGIQSCIAFALNAEAAKKPAETGFAGEFVNETANEGTFKFNVAPGAGAPFFIVVLGP